MLSVLNGFALLSYSININFSSLDLWQFKQLLLFFCCQITITANLDGPNIAVIVICVMSAVMLADSSSFSPAVWNMFVEVGLTVVWCLINSVSLEVSDAATDTIGISRAVTATGFR